MVGGTHAKLAGIDTQLADNLLVLQKKLERVGASAAAKRIELAGTNFDRLPPEMIYSWIDPSRALVEIEEVSGRAARRFSAARNLLALAPLILTWLALSWASGQYQQVMDAALAAKDYQTANMPFLVLWEQGFSTHTPFTFSHTAFLDFLLLVAIVLLTFLAQTRDERAHHRAAVIAQDVDAVVVPLMEASSRGRLPQNANPQDWARVVQDTVKTAMDDVKSVMATAQKVIQDVGAETTQLVRTEMRPIVHDFGKSVSSLHSGLQQYQQSVSSIGKTIQDLGTAASQVANASTSLSNTFGKYQQTADSIDQSTKDLSANQKQVVQASTQLAGSLTAAAKSNAATATIVQDSATKLNQAENALGFTANQLKTTSTDLNKASQRLQRVVLQSPQGKTGNGGVIGQVVRWLIG